MIPTESTAPPRLADLDEVVRYFLWLGATGFGGPVALCGLMERDLVERRGWLGKEQMRDVIAVCQTLPGPLAVQVAIFMGYMQCGFWGAWAAGGALILPASVMVAVLAAAYVHVHELPWLTAAIYGMSPAVVALILVSWWRLVRLGMDDLFQYAIGAVCVLATWLLPGLLTAMFLSSGLLGIGWYRRKARREAAGPRLLDVGAFVLLAQVAWFCLLTGAFTFGGGLAVVPLLEKGLVQQGQWLTSAEFLTAIAVGMVTPGPVMTAATFAGYLVAGPLGAVVCTVAIYLPSFLLVLFAAPLLMRHRQSPTVQGFTKGVYAAAMGSILASTVLLGALAIKDTVTAVIGMAALAAVLRLRVSGSLLVGAAALAGLLAFHFGAHR